VAQKALGTKSAHEANIRAKPVLIEFDRTIESARQLVKEQPLRNSLSRVEIARMAEFYYAMQLGNDEQARRIRRDIREKWAVQFQNSSLLPPEAPLHGLTEEEFQRHGKAHHAALNEAQAALARGNIDYVVPEVEELLDVWFRVRLDRSSVSYRDLAAAVLTQQVKALRAIQQRQTGEPIETPPQPEPDNAAVVPAAESLRAAFEGWQKARNPGGGHGCRVRPGYPAIHRTPR
jgi:hypothetical protein